MMSKYKPCYIDYWQKSGTNFNIDDYTRLVGCRLFGSDKIYQPLTVAVAMNPDVAYNLQVDTNRSDWNEVLCSGVKKAPRCSRHRARRPKSRTKQRTASPGSGWLAIPTNRSRTGPGDGGAHGRSPELSQSTASPSAVSTRDTPVGTESGPAIAVLDARGRRYRVIDEHTLHLAPGTGPVGKGETRIKPDDLVSFLIETLDGIDLDTGKVP